MELYHMQQLCTRSIFIIFIGIIKVIAQPGWNNNWQQQQQPPPPPNQPPPQAQQNPSSLWSGQPPPPQGQNFNQNPPPPYQGRPTNVWRQPSNNPPQGFQQNAGAPPNNVGWIQYSPQQQQQPPPGWPKSPPSVPAGAVTSAPVPGQAVESNGNHVPKPSQWLPPGHPDAPKGPQSWNPGQGIKGQNKNSAKAQLIAAIQKMTAAFNNFQVTLEKLLTSLGKLTQLQ